eukprot:TRINITY_DN9829_c0_g1_i1.p1 TRINITY_DN9829_c0_g1~~TRINITY_DN9829_c0_g1_i1.p1  ORF type:complete len:147 (-),score=14.54 TRINITY_DN9829_c0_g1_i1:963-1403(-)
MLTQLDQDALCERDPCMHRTSRQALEAATCRLVHEFSVSCAATHEEVKLLLSYKSEAEVRDFYGTIADIVSRYGELADLSVAEARHLLPTPAKVREQLGKVEDFLHFVVSVVARYGTSALASAREVKSISKYMHQDEIWRYLLTND